MGLEMERIERGVGVYQIIAAIKAIKAQFFRISVKLRGVVYFVA